MATDDRATKKKKFRSWTEAAKIVMESHSQTPMSHKNIYEEIVNRGLRVASNQQASVSALNGLLHVHSRGPQSVFYRLRIEGATNNASVLFGLRGDIPPGAQLYEVDEDSDSEDATTTTQQPSSNRLKVQYARFPVALLKNVVNANKSSARLNCNSDPDKQPAAAVTREAHSTSEVFVEAAEAELSAESGNSVIDTSTTQSTRAAPPNGLVAGAAAAAKSKGTTCGPLRATAVANKTAKKLPIRPSTHQSSTCSAAAVAATSSSSGVSLAATGGATITATATHCDTNNNPSGEILERLRVSTRRSAGRESPKSVLLPSLTASNGSSIPSISVTPPGCGQQLSSEMGCGGALSNSFLVSHVTSPEMPRCYTMREILSSLPALGFKPHKRPPKKLNLAAQLEETRKACIDLETPDSILVNLNIKEMLTPATFAALPQHYQQRLVAMLPAVDRVAVVSNTMASTTGSSVSTVAPSVARMALRTRQSTPTAVSTPLSNNHWSDDVSTTFDRQRTLRNRSSSDTTWSSGGATSSNGSGAMSPTPSKLRRRNVSEPEWSVTLSDTALTNEFFASACQEWRERLAEGELTPETQARLKLELERNTRALDPWKLKHFEAVWGDKLNMPSVVPSNVDVGIVTGSLVGGLRSSSPIIGASEPIVEPVQTSSITSSVAAVATTTSKPVLTSSVVPAPAPRARTTLTAMKSRSASETSSCASSGVGHVTDATSGASLPGHRPVSKRLQGIVFEDPLPPPIPLSKRARTVNHPDMPATVLGAAKRLTPSRLPDPRLYRQSAISISRRRLHYTRYTADPTTTGSAEERQEYVPAWQKALEEYDQQHPFAAAAASSSSAALAAAGLSGQFLSVCSPTRSLLRGERHQQRFSPRRDDDSVVSQQTDTDRGLATGSDESRSVSRTDDTDNEGSLKAESTEIDEPATAVVYRIENITADSGDSLKETATLHHHKDDDGSSHSPNNDKKEVAICEVAVSKEEFACGNEVQMDVEDCLTVKQDDSGASDATKCDALCVVDDETSKNSVEVVKEALPSKDDEGSDQIACLETTENMQAELSQDDNDGVRNDEVLVGPVEDISSCCSSDAVLSEMVEPIVEQDDVSDSKQLMCEAVSVCESSRELSEPPLAKEEAVPAKEQPVQKDDVCDQSTEVGNTKNGDNADNDASGSSLVETIEKEMGNCHNSSADSNNQPEVERTSISASPLLVRDEPKCQDVCDLFDTAALSTLNDIDKLRDSIKDPSQEIIDSAEISRSSSSSNNEEELIGEPKNLSDAEVSNVVAVADKNVEVLGNDDFKNDVVFKTTHGDDHSTISDLPINDSVSEEDNTMEVDDIPLAEEGTEEPILPASVEEKSDVGLALFEEKSVRYSVSAYPVSSATKPVLFEEEAAFFGDSLTERIDDVEDKEVSPRANAEGNTAAEAVMNSSGDLHLDFIIDSYSAVEHASKSDEQLSMSPTVPALNESSEDVESLPPLDELDKKVLLQQSDSLESVKRRDDSSERESLCEGPITSSGNDGRISGEMPELEVIEPLSLIAPPVEANVENEVNKIVSCPPNETEREGSEELALCSTPIETAQPCVVSFDDAFEMNYRLGVMMGNIQDNLPPTEKEKQGGNASESSTSTSYVSPIEAETTELLSTSSDANPDEVKQDSDLTKSTTSEPSEGAKSDEPEATMQNDQVVLPVVERPMSDKENQHVQLDLDESGSHEEPKNAESVSQSDSSSNDTVPLVDNDEYGEPDDSADESTEEEVLTEAGERSGENASTTEAEDEEATDIDEVSQFTESSEGSRDGMSSIRSRSEQGVSRSASSSGNIDGFQNASRDTPAQMLNGVDTSQSPSCAVAVNDAVIAPEDIEPALAIPNGDVDNAERDETPCDGSDQTEVDDGSTDQESPLPCVASPGAVANGVMEHSAQLSSMPDLGDPFKLESIPQLNTITIKKEPTTETHNESGKLSGDLNATSVSATDSSLAAVHSLLMVAPNQPTTAAGTAVVTQGVDMISPSVVVTPSLAPLPAATIVALSPNPSSAVIARDAASGGGGGAAVALKPRRKRRALSCRDLLLAAEEKRRKAAAAQLGGNVATVVIPTIQSVVKDAAVAAHKAGGNAQIPAKATPNGCPCQLRAMVPCVKCGRFLHQQCVQAPPYVCAMCEVR